MSNDDWRDAFAALKNKTSGDRLYNQKMHCIFEVDLDYPLELHDRGDNYSLAPETINIDAEITILKQH